MDRVRSGYINYGRNFDALCPIPNTKARQKKLPLPLNEHTKLENLKSL